MSDTVTVGGITLSPQTDLISLLRRQMLEGSVWSVFRDQGPEEGLNLAMKAVESTELEPRMTDAVMQLLTDSNPTVRSRAVTLAKNFASRFSSPDLLTVLQNHRELYEGVKPIVDSDDPDLAWGLLEAMSQHALSSEKVRDRLRKAASDPTNGARLLAALTQDDTDWVLAHGVELTAGNPLNAEIILANLADTQRLEFVQAFRKQPKNLQRDLSTAIDGAIDDPDEQRRLKGSLAS
jgi:hypothetical protein